MSNSRSRVASPSDAIFVGQSGPVTPIIRPAPRKLSANAAPFLFSSSSAAAPQQVDAPAKEAVAPKKEEKEKVIPPLAQQRNALAVLHAFLDDYHFLSDIAIRRKLFTLKTENHLRKFTPSQVMDLYEKLTNMIEKKEQVTAQFILDELNKLSPDEREYDLSQQIKGVGNKIRELRLR